MRVPPIGKPERFAPWWELAHRLSVEARELPLTRRLSAEVRELPAELRRLRGTSPSFWGSRLSLLAGLLLAGAGTLGAAVWSLATAGAAGADGDRTVVAGDAQADGPPRLVLDAPRTFVFPGGPLRLPWPATGRAAVEVQGIGLLAHAGAMTDRVPIASIAKTMTAYVVLADHPLGPHDQGPTITVSAPEAALYEKAIALDESAVPLRTGERITERQALEAMMLASAGDVADLLAVWDRGSVGAFAARMNAQARALGMTGTDYTDPTGLASDTVSTMADQLRLAEAVRKVPALTAVVAEPSASIPVAGEVDNINRDLGADGVDGIKTGTTAAAGSCLLFSAQVQVGGHTLTLLGIVLGQPGSAGVPWTALAAARNLVESAESVLGTATVVAPGTAVARLERGGATVGRLGVAEPVTVVGWPGLTYRVALAGRGAAARLTVTQTGHKEIAAYATLRTVLVPARAKAPAARPSRDATAPATPPPAARATPRSTRRAEDD